ncbi:MAG: hypothetical protein PHY16_07820 [Methylobacter sp.]|nr:hypothetical protein [Methylobacter sp.]
MSNKLPLFTIIFILLLSACALQSSKPLQIQGLNHLPALAAEFETIIIEDDDDSRQHSHQWRFWRTANRAETHNLQDNSGEIWTKSADGTITYQRVFHNQQQVIDYVPGDLKTIGSQPGWQAIATLLSQAMIAPLLADDREDILNRSAIHFQSKTPITR